MSYPSMRRAKELANAKSIKGHPLSARQKSFFGGVSKGAHPKDNSIDHKKERPK